MLNQLTKYIVYTAIVTLCGGIHLAAQTAPGPELTLERVFSSDELIPETFGPARWLADGSSYTTVEPSAASAVGQDIVRYDAATGSRQVLVSSARLIPEGHTTALEIDDYRWSPDGRFLLLFTNSRRVWRQNTRGDYWVIDRETWAMHQLGGDARPSTLMFAKFAPTGRRVAYVREHNLYVEAFPEGQVQQLTSDGSDTLINGTFDWVYEEELGLRDGYRWSPDGRFIAYWQLDSSEVRNFTLINNTDSLYPQLVTIPYPKAGERNSSGRIGVVSAEGGETQWMEVPGDPSNHYIARMDWAYSSETIVLQQLNRLQNTNRVMLADAETGEVNTLLTELDEAWLDVGNDLRWLNTGAEFTWVSERDGWRHVYRVSRDDGDPILITPGDFDVISVEAVDEPGNWLYFIASPSNPTQRYLYRTALDGQTEPERLTPANAAGTHRYDIAPGASWAFHTHSSFGTPPVVNVVRLPSHEIVRTPVTNAALRASLSTLERGTVEFFRVDIGQEVELDGWRMMPPDFDPTKRYPILFHVYGEPAGQTVLDRWGGDRYLWHLLLTQRGYLVVSVDNRGTPAPRGRAWRKSIYRQIGILASADQAAAARAILEWPYVDPARVGIWGWSGGGSMTLNMMFRHPDIYQTGISVAPVTNQRFYDTIYQERYMGLPSDNEAGFTHGSPITHVDGLEGNLLLVHGTGDDNVHYQSSEALVNALIEKNKVFTMMAYPNRTHSIREGENTSRHLFELLTRYLEQHLPRGPSLQ
ncbi:MAG TPA: S9 family peptidase [Vicinamibacterales bacterium]|jgi:dipeptidyl-peptidase-4|nr:S9 family peptidase [Vicinamibacterales bacterium]|tara:strand:+ start:3409 stop:5676 length:2268 start_codon:yes stop_codon:yes gene_type:complete